MRQPKYKAWHKAEKIMCEVNLINFDKGAFLIGVKKGEDEICDKSIVIAPEDGRFCNWDEIELLEYTGLKDKNGVEIFKGDYLLTDNRRVVEVVWFNEIGQWDTVYEYDKFPNKEFIGLPVAAWNNRCEVIGNRHGGANLPNNL